MNAESTGMKNVCRPGKSNRSNFFIVLTWVEKFLAKTNYEMHFNL